MSDFNFDTGLRSFSDRIKGERERRLARAAKILTFGTAYLDAALGGIFQNDLILLGAKTGLGKTALASSIAHANAKVKKRVAYFALEAEADEIERRIKYQALADKAWNTPGLRDMRGKVNYFDWYTGRLDYALAALEKRLDEQLAQDYRTLQTFYRDRDFGIEDLEKRLHAIASETDLIILDHLHYVDTDDPNENRGFKIIVKRLRDTALVISKPVVAVAHVRKGDRRMKRVVPDIEDFHGTSDVPKVATKAIMIAPTEYENDDPTLWPTYLQAVKCRFDGSRTRFVAIVNYNLHRNAYNEGFLLGRLRKGGEEVEQLDFEKWPLWAKEAHAAELKRVEREKQLEAF